MATKPDIVIYNSMTKQKDIFKPKVEGKVGMYVCGVTAYDYSHIGHARAYVAFDVLSRYFRDRGFDVTYVRNFTDVDDKIIKRAKDDDKDPLSLSSMFCQEFIKDMIDLQCSSPTHQPKVSDHMDQIRNMIAKIIENGCAYAVDGDVYFAVGKFPNYGRLSGRKIEDNRAGERVAVDSRKRNPADFALWKAAKPGEISWDSPWGPGRPGWHIECSAMSAEYLTHSFDIHGGGSDLIFPHHENELAQSCAACSDANISYWMHNGFVNVNDEKMSKSLKNFFTIREVTNVYHPLALRYFLLDHHYRGQVNYSIAAIEKAADSLFYAFQTLQDCEDALLPFRLENSNEEAKSKSKPVKIAPDAQKLSDDFDINMSDDLQTSTVLRSCLNEAFKQMNSSLSKFKKKQPKKQQLQQVDYLIALEGEIKHVLGVLGLLPDMPYSAVLQQLKDKALKRADLTEENVQQLIEERAVARKNKDFARSDQIRADLQAKGIALMDVGKDTIWRPCVTDEM